MREITNIRTISWKFRDSSIEYPELAGREVKITSPDMIYDNFRFMFDNEVKEKFTVFWLNSMNQVIGFEVISVGNLNSSIVSPREVFRGAIVASCASIIIAHNHPSGNPEPSNEDIKITKVLIESGKLLDIHVRDHIIFTTKNGYTSFVERRLI